MTDLTKITAPLGLLDAETRAALMATDYEHCEVFAATGTWLRAPEHSMWSECYVYRVKTSPPAPRDFWLWRNGTGAVMGLFRNATAPEDVHFLTGDEIIHVREVLG